MLGSVSRQCATHATVPVAVVPADTQCVPVRHLVVGFDGSPNAREAVAWALQFAPAAAQIDVVRAVDIVPWSDQASIRERFPTEVEMASAEFEAAMDELDPARRARRSLQLQDAAASALRSRARCRLGGAGRTWSRPARRGVARFGQYLDVARSVACDRDRASTPSIAREMEGSCSTGSSFQPTVPTIRGEPLPSARHWHASAMRRSSCSRSSRTRLT